MTTPSEKVENLMLYGMTTWDMLFHLLLQILDQPILINGGKNLDLGLLARAKDMS